MSNSKPKTESLNRALDCILKWLQRLFDTGAVVCLTGIALVILYQIFARYALPKSPSWTEELARYLFIYTVVLASGTILIKRRHVRLELFQHRFSKKGKLIYSLTCHLIAAVFCIWLLQYAWKYTVVGDRKTSPALGLKMSWVFGSTFLFFALVSLTSVILALKDFLYLIDKKES